MAIRTYKVTLDTKNSIAPEPVFLRQGDKTGAVVIDATLMDNGSPVSLSGITPMFKANTADGQAVIADSTGFTVTDSANGEFTYKVPNALGAVPGKIKVAYFSFSDSSGTESTFDVAFVVKMAVDITQNQSEDYITIIDGTLKSLSDKIDAMNSNIQTILNAYNQGDFYNKSETDSRDASTLTSAKSYTDSGDSTTLTNAKSYADTQDSATLSSAKSYTDNLSKEASVAFSDGSSITGFAEGSISFSRKGNVVIAYFDVRLGAVENGWGIVKIPSGFTPSSISANGHYSFTKSGLEAKLASNKFYSQVNDSGSWWIGSCVYFTNDPFPA